MAQEQVPPWLPPVQARRNNDCGSTRRRTEFLLQLGRNSELDCYETRQSRPLSSAVVTSYRHLNMELLVIAVRLEEDRIWRSSFLLIAEYLQFSDAG